MYYTNAPHYRAMKQGKAAADRKSEYAVYAREQLAKCEAGLLTNCEYCDSLIAFKKAMKSKG